MLYNIPVQLDYSFFGWQNPKRVIALFLGIHETEIMYLASTDYLGVWNVDS